MPIPHANDNDCHLESPNRVQIRKTLLFRRPERQFPAEIRRSTDQAATQPLQRKRLEIESSLTIMDSSLGYSFQLCLSLTSKEERMQATLDTAVEEHVDAARSAAACILKAVDKAETLSVAFQKITEQDDWERYKMAKCLLQQVEQLVPEAVKAIEKVRCHLDALPEVPVGTLGVFAKRTAISAYECADHDFQRLDDLVSQVREAYMALIGEFLSPASRGVRQKLR